MLDQKIIAALAARLHQAEQSRTQIGHFSKEFPEMTIDDGYAIQRAWVAIKRSEGRKILEAGAELLKSTAELGFVAAGNREYDNYRAFYKTTQVK